MQRRTTGPATRALIVDDHPIISDALAAALLSLKIFETVDKETTLEAAEACLRNATAYDLLLLDLHLGEKTGGESMLALRERFLELPVIIFSADESSTTVAAAFEYGVQGYIPKSTPMPVVISAIRVVLAGGTYIPPEAARMLGFTTRPAVNDAGPGPAPLPTFSPRQQQVLHYLLKGLPNKAIGSRLEMADGTVKSHLNSIYRSLAVNSRAQLILKARDMGLI